MSANPDSQKMLAELAKLETQALVELFILDATALGGDILRFFPGTSQRSEPVSFQGNVYSPLVAEAKGFKLNGKGEIPRPRISFSNLSGIFSGLAIRFNDLVGAKVTRKRTFAQFLDGARDSSGVLTGNPNIELPEDVYLINRKMGENKLVVEFELCSPIDTEGVQLPRRQVQANICGVRYRSPECSFAENRVVADAQNHAIGSVQNYRGLWQAQTAGVDTVYFKDDVVYILNNGIKIFYILLIPTLSGIDSQPPNKNFWQEDRCSKLNTGCKMRFDPNNANKPLPLAAFPGTAELPNV